MIEAKIGFGVDDIDTRSRPALQFCIEEFVLPVRWKEAAEASYEDQGCQLDWSFTRRKKQQQR